MVNNLKKGIDIYFVGEKIPMKVMASNERYAICSRKFHRREDAGIVKSRMEMGDYYSFKQGYEDLKDETVYTILDFDLNWKAPHSSYGHDYDFQNEESCNKCLADLMSGEIELSRRNHVILNINWEKTKN